MKINEYKLNDFNCSSKAIWITGVWTYPRLEPRYNNMFIAKSEVAVKHSSIFIPEWLVESFNYKNRHGVYKYTFPHLVRQYDVSKDSWQKFKSMYPFKGKDKCM